MYRIYIFLTGNKYQSIMAEISQGEIQEFNSLDQSSMIIKAQKKSSIDNSSISLGIQQSYEQQVSEKPEIKQQSSNHNQQLKESQPFSVVMSAIDQKDESTDKTQSIHYYNAQVQGEYFLSENFSEMQRIKELQEEVEDLRLENKELKKKVENAGMQNGGVSFENSIAHAEEESGAMQADNTDPVDYKSKYMQYKQKCKYLMNKLAGLEAIMNRKK